MIREAEQKDLDEIFSLYDKVKLDRGKLDDQEYQTKVQQRGFLLGLDTRETFVHEMEVAYRFLVDEDGSKINGYLVADHSEEQKFYDDEYKTWFSTELKDDYYQSSKGMTIASIATDPESSRKGIATGLLKSLEEQLVQEGFNNLYSIVTLAPLTNCPTIIWHTKMGFKRLAMGRPRRLFDLDNYSAVLLYKELK